MPTIVLQVFSQTFGCRYLVCILRHNDTVLLRQRNGMCLMCCEPIMFGRVVLCSKYGNGYNTCQIRYLHKNYKATNSTNPLTIIILKLYVPCCNFKPKTRRKTNRMHGYRNCVIVVVHKCPYNRSDFSYLFNFLRNTLQNHMYIYHGCRDIPMCVKN